MTGSLHGIRVLDLTTNVAGPYTTRILAELGADVVKVERPVTGDDTRHWGPPFVGGSGLTFLDLNRGKRSVVLDIDDDDDREVLHRLVERCDVFVQNLRPGALDKRGLGADELRARHPSLVYCRITGFGSTGPRLAAPAFDPLIQAFAGLMSLTGEPDRPPARIPVSVLDRGAGMWAVIGILDALLRRERSGAGDLVEVSLLETAVAWEAVHVMQAAATGIEPQRLGSGSPGVSPHEAYRARDGYVLIAAANQRLWQKLCGALDAQELASDERFSTNAGRVHNREALRDELERRLGRADVATWVETFAAAGVPASRINGVLEALADPQVEHLRLLVPVETPDGDPAMAVRTPLERPERIAPRAPALGEHQQDVLADWLTPASDGKRAGDEYAGDERAGDEGAAGG